MSDEIRDQWIEHYFQEGYKYSEILNFLAKRGFDLSMSTLKRILKTKNLKRKYIEEDVEGACKIIFEELERSGGGLGYRMMWLRIKAAKIIIYRDTVLHLLNIIDPEGIEARSKYRLKRRLYNVPGSSFLWHGDGYDKLKPFGFSIHGCMDGWSRKLFWLVLLATNKNPDVVSCLYLKAVKKLGHAPVIIRLDKGFLKTH